MDVSQLLENVIAITELFVVDERYPDFCNRHTEYFQGHVGLYRWLATATRAFTDAEQGVVWDGEWYEVTEQFALFLYSPGAHIAGHSEFLAHAMSLMEDLPRPSVVIDGVPQSPPEPQRQPEPRTRVVDV